MAKRDISWKRTTEAGERIQVYVKHLGDRWIFYWRQGRNDRWLEMPEPPLEDWLELLDAVRRRAGRGLLRPEEEANLKKIIRNRFPGAESAG